MKKKIADIIISIMLFFTGVCLLFWADKVIEIVTILLGSIIILYGVKSIIKYVKNKTGSVVTLTTGVSSIIVGIILLIKQTIIADTISFIVGIFMIISSIGSLVNNIEQKGRHFGMGLGLSITGIIIGALCIVGKLLIPNIILQFMGVLLIVYGVTNLINSIIAPLISNKNN